MSSSNLITAPSLTIVILNYNTAEWMKKVLQSLQKYHLSQSKYETQVVMVDNGSADDSVSVVKKQFPWVEVIEAGENKGFAGGNNLALRQLKTKYGMLLNSDTEFSEKTQLDKILEYMEEHSEVGMVTPRLDLTNGKIDLASHRGEPTPWASLTYFTGLSKLFPKVPLFAQYHQTYKNFAEVHEVDACSGAAMIFSKAAIEKVGLLDEDFFMYAEDLDWCKRLRDAGYKIVYFPDSVITHHKYKSGRGNKDKKLAKKTAHHFYQTMLQYYDKHYREHYPNVVRWFIKLFISIKEKV
jgi:GT2 family glycosyltransferase